METINNITKEKLCKDALKKMMLEAKKVASAEFKSFPDKVSIDLKYSNDDQEVILSRLLYDEYNKYDKIFNVSDTAKVKAYLLKHFIKTKEIYDNDLNFNDIGYEGQRQRIVDQLLVLRKIEYLEKLKSEVQLSSIQPKIEKIKWLRGVSEFGYMVSLLEKKGYIELPIGINAEGAYEKLAKILFETFDVTNSFASLKDALNPERNRLSSTKRIKLEDFPMDLPDAQQLGTLKNLRKEK